MSFEQSELLPQYSEDQKMAAERQINDLQRVVDYMIKEYSIEELVEKYQIGRDRNKNKMVIPKAHRKFVWDEQKQSLFIESVLLGLPIAHLFVAELPKTENRFEIVDGSQRLRTFEAFIDNKLILNGLQKLTLLNGFRFKDLPLFRQRSFKARTVWLIELTHHANDAVRNDIFTRINQTVPFVTDYKSNFARFLEYCTRNSKFTQLCFLNVQQKAKGEDQEMVLRFFEYADNWEPFTPIVKDFNAEYIKEKNKGFNAALMEDDFENMLDFVEKHFPYGFRNSENHHSTSKTRFETISVGVHLALKEKQDLIPTQPIKSWLESKIFIEYVTNDVASDCDKIRARIEFVKNKLLAKK